MGGNGTGGGVEDDDSGLFRWGNTILLQQAIIIMHIYTWYVQLPHAHHICPAYPLHTPITNHHLYPPTITYAAGGTAALWGCVLVGPRLGRWNREGHLIDFTPNNPTHMTLGVLILWFGWFGYV